ncbi:hypothetical protein HPB52_022252 [Rhipicephalus sanguineus]|uniref:Uncharacterized protein n=1 Tax=Rhipicephalus sanguineus TaxID=34632 RepID=A0A9D4YQZ7_RHISA|nr:hypothetical protein HPB52_022252 [Rhipicephalus sanguineus]
MLRHPQDPSPNSITSGDSYARLLAANEELTRKTLNSPEPSIKQETVWYGNYGTGAERKAGVVQAPEGHRTVAIKAADGEHHRRHYSQLSARKTDSAGLAAGEAQVKQEPGVEAPQTKAGEARAPVTSREGPQSPEMT